MVYIKDALCAKMEQPDVLRIFFPEHGGDNHVAKELCYHCPMLDRCRYDTLLDDFKRRLATDESSRCWGVAGALTGQQRDAIVSQLIESEAGGYVDRGTPPATLAPSGRPRIHSLRDPRTAELFAKATRLRKYDRASCEGCRTAKRRCSHADSMPKARREPGRLVRASAHGER